MKEKTDGTIIGKVDYAEKEIADDLDRAARWTPMALKLFLSKSETEKASC
jgi:hypothetical protein